MFRYTLAVAALIGMVAADSDHWAVIVAGSKGFWNYRHQADACHAYQIMKKNGIPESNIIMMAYDDVANDPENPFPGKIFNKPGNESTDVYAGCNIDYKGESVTPSNFLNILRGNDTNVTGGNGKVLKSNENSKVFINFVDHGGVGLIAFPNEYLYANDLNTTITYMFEHKMYKEMVLYIEACESGSMFEGILSANISVYALTAANAQESSKGTYCYPNDKINNTHINTCLGDLFSINWLEDADKTDPSSETLISQFTLVKNLTRLSHVMQYGDLTFQSQPVGNFYANMDLPDIASTSQSLFSRLFSRAKALYASNLQEQSDVDHLTATDSRDIKLQHLYATVTSTRKSHTAQLDLAYELTSRMRADHVFEHFSPQGLQAGEAVLPKNFDCLKTLVSTYDKSCGKLDDYSLQYVKYFVQACEAMSSNDSQAELVNKLILACTH